MRGDDPISRAFRRQDDRAASHMLGGTAPPEPLEVKEQRVRRARTLRAAALPLAPDAHAIDDARALTFSTVLAYLHEPEPDRVLVVQLSAGAGKTHLGVEATNEMGRLGRLGAWIGPRHAMYAETLAIVRATGGDAERWTEWLPHQDDAGGRREATCLYPGVIVRMADRGLRPLDACESLCGWPYINHQCGWHAQKRRVTDEDRRVVFCQHKHLAIGHPLSGLFDYAVVDENPLDAVPAVWSIPADAVVPRALATGAGFKEVLERLQALARSGQRMFGRDLMSALLDGLAVTTADGGGPRRSTEVHHGARALALACRNAIEMAGRVKVELRNPEDAVLLDYNHAARLARELARELDAYDRGVDYAARVLVGPVKRDGDVDDYADDTGLTLLGRHEIPWRGAVPGSDQGWPAHMVFLDATAGPRAGSGATGDRDFYEMLVRRPVEVVRLDVEAHHRVYQVVDHANGVHALKGKKNKETGETPTLSKRGEDLVADIRHMAMIFRRQGRRVGIITYKRLVDAGEVAGLADVDRAGHELVGHFGAERGTNAFGGVDDLIIAGTPQPPPEALHTLAKCLALEDDGQPRVASFLVDGRLPYDFVERPYNCAGPDGPPVGLDTRDYPAEPVLAALLWQKRDAELIQAVNRARGVLRSADRPVNVWLLTNHPTEIPLTRLLTRRELYDAPPGVDQSRPEVWTAVVTIAEAFALDQGYVTSSQLREGMAAMGTDVSGPTADKYVRLLASHVDGWDTPAPGEVVALRRAAGRGRPPTNVAVYRGEDEPEAGDAPN